MGRHDVVAPGQRRGRRVEALALDDAGSLYAGGNFTGRRGQRQHVARWDGAAWSALGRRHEYRVFALALDDAANTVRRGHFTRAGGVSVNYIAKWDGMAWSALGSGMKMQHTVNALAVDDARTVYAGGVHTAGGVSANYIAKWDGTAWSALGSGVGETLYSPSVLALAIDGG